MNPIHSPTQTTIYHQRINAVIDFVRVHLEEDLSLATLADVAGFSPFHFHRIFKALTDETLNDLVTRLRLERAAALLRATPDESITTVAFACGFNSVATFSRAFKRHYGLTASSWDRKSRLENSKIDQRLPGFPRYTMEELDAMAKSERYRVTIRHLPAQRLAYIRIYDSYSDFTEVTAAYTRLIDWYRTRGGKLSATTLYGMSQDDPEITPLHLCRFDWCLQVPMDWKAEGEVAIVDFPACTVASIHVHGDIAQEDRALQYLFRYWLPHSRYQPANLPGMEIYRQQPPGWQHYDMDCAIPVVPL